MARRKIAPCGRHKNGRIKACPGKKHRRRHKR